MRVKKICCSKCVKETKFKKLKVSCTWNKILVLLSSWTRYGKIMIKHVIEESADILEILDWIEHTQDDNILY